MKQAIIYYTIDGCMEEKVVKENKLKTFAYTLSEALLNIDNKDWHLFQPEVLDIDISG